MNDETLTSEIPASLLPAFGAMIATELHDLPVSRADRTVGSMFFLKFGEVRAASSHSKRTHEHGEWDLLVEAGRWRLSVGDTWIDENSEIETIDEILTAILGSRLGDFSITSSGALTVSISNNSRLSIQPAARADQLSEWILFRRERWSLAFESGAALLDVQRHIDVGDG